MNSGKTPAQVVSITGTDTGVGKSVITALLLCHLRNKGLRALAIKPFCSGGRADVELLEACQDGELSQNEITPFYFPEPIAPLVAARKARRTIALQDVLDHVHSIKCRCDWLIVEGVGGVMVPIGEGYAVADMIQSLGGAVVMVAANRLGVVNHSLLSIKALRERGMSRVSIALNNAGEADESSASNADLLRELLVETPVISIPFVDVSNCSSTGLRNAARNLEKTLEQFLAFATFTPLSHGAANK